MSLLRQVNAWLFDKDGNGIGSFRGGLDVHLGHEHNIPVNQYFYRLTGVSNTLASDSAVEATQIVLNSATGFNVGDTIKINTTATERTFPTITAIATNTLTLDRPLDLAHTAGDAVEVISYDMAVDGSVTPVSFKLIPIGTETWVISRFISDMIHSSAADYSKFGDLTALTNGVVLRVYADGVFGTFTNWKSNKEIYLDTGNITFTDKAGGGKYSTSFVGSLLDLDRVQVTITGPDDYLEIIIQDDLTGLDAFYIKGQGLVELDS
jgi:hypothetical protein